jgi:predicted nucleic acid-binding protein
LLYRFDSANRRKQELASSWFDALWLADAGRLSWQVLIEFYSAATRKSYLKPSTARSAVRELRQWNREYPNDSMLERAWHWCDAAKINFWDALIVASAEKAESRWLLSEDFQEGRKFGKITVVNPFITAPSTILPVK